MSPTQELMANAQHYTDRLLSEGAPLKIAATIILSIPHYTGATWAHVPDLYRAAVLLLMLDWFTGTLRAMITKTNNSAAGKRGIVKSVEYLALLLLAYLMGLIGGPILGLAPIFAATVVGITEGTSFLENVRDISKHFGYKNPILDALIRIGRLAEPQELVAFVANKLSGMTGPLGASGAVAGIGMAIVDAIEAPVEPEPQELGTEKGEDHANDQGH